MSDHTTAFPPGDSRSGFYELASGVTIKWMNNAGGGRTYFSDECGPMASVVDTALSSIETLSAVLAIEIALQKRELRNP